MVFSLSFAHINPLKTSTNKMLDALWSIIHHLSTPFFVVNIARIIIPLATLGIGCYLLIIYPQHEQRRRAQLVNERLRPGATITTANNLCGTIVCITQASVVIELATGQKTEILKQTITNIAS